MSPPFCRPRPLTLAQQALFIRRSVEVNPANALEARVVMQPAPRRGGPRRLVLQVGRRWPAGPLRLSVQFLDSPSAALRKRILLHMNAWAERADVAFSETRGSGQVRIARLDAPAALAGYWSYVGTEILAIEPDAPTMNLQGFTLRTPEAEFTRVVRHETGHTLGFEHEHLRAALVRRIDRRKAIAWFARHQGWSAAETVRQVLTPLPAAAVQGTRQTDPLSIMCYPIPAEITRDGQPIEGSTNITARDHAFAAKAFPRAEEVTAAAARAPRRAAAARAATASATQDANAAAYPPQPFHLIVLDAFDGAQGKPRARPAFARVLASYAGAHVTAPLALRAANGQPTRFGAIIRQHERIKGYTQFARGEAPSDHALLAFGTDLFEALFSGGVLRLYRQALAHARGRALDLVFTSMVPWIAEKPWEFAFDPLRRRFIATRDVNFMRNVLTAVPADRVAPRAGALRIVIATAQPAGLGALSAAQEEALIRRGMAPLVAAGAARIEVIARATPQRLAARLDAGDCDIVHFIGHGEFDAATQQGALLFEDGAGGRARVEGAALRALLCGRGLSMVFLNACQSGTGSRARFNQGVAQTLVAAGLPAAVANQYSVLDVAAMAFARRFYARLAQGDTLGEATRAARQTLRRARDGERIDWAVPVVYARDPALRLCAAKPASSEGAS